MTRVQLGAIASLIFLASGAAAILYAAGDAAPGLSRQKAEQVKKAVTDRMFDPQAATFRDFATGKGSAGDLFVCGAVNGKNRFGAYVGFVPFRGYFDGKQFVIVDFGQDEAAASATVLACRGTGVW